MLKAVLDTLSVPEEKLRPGKPRRVHLDDRRDIPTLITFYGEVPVTLASAGVRRILSMAYLLVWAWREHMEAARLTGRPTTSEILILVDEVELHLHPQWQRVILPALLGAIKHLSAEVNVQIVATTHAPLVLASLEPHFDTDRDALFTFDLDKKAGVVKVEKAAWRRRGDASNWLTSDVFDLGMARQLTPHPALPPAESRSPRPPFVL